MRILLPLLLVSLFAAAAADDTTRIRAIEERLLAPCCYSDTVHLHNSEVAQQMRSEIAALVRSGQTDEQILSKYRAQYGARVLTEPDGAIGQWMHIIPVVLILGGIAVVAAILRRVALRNQRQAPAVSAPAVVLTDEPNDWI